jgi:hypothetical protein
MFNSEAVDVIEVPAICSVVAFTSPLEPYITALLFAIVPADEPSTKFNSEAVDVTPSNMLSSEVVDVTPSKRFISVAVAVTATSSFIFGLVNVLFVSVCVAAIPVIVSVVAGKVNVMLPENAECAGACNLA